MEESLAKDMLWSAVAKSVSHIDFVAAFYMSSTEASTLIVAGFYSSGSSKKNKVGIY